MKAQPKKKPAKPVVDKTSKERGAAARKGWVTRKMPNGILGSKKKRGKTITVDKPSRTTVAAKLKSLKSELDGLELIDPTIIDIRIAFNNYGQDLLEELTNESTLTYSNGVKVSAKATHPIEWQWSTVMPVNGVFTKVVIANTFNLNIAQASNFLSNGEFQLRLQGTVEKSGFIFAHIIPSFLQHNLVGGTWPPYMPFPGGLSAQVYRAQEYQQSWAAPHWERKHLVGGKVGDLDLNGVVNVTDVLIVTSNFGT